MTSYASAKSKISEIEFFYLWRGSARNSGGHRAEEVVVLGERRDHGVG